MSLLTSIHRAVAATGAVLALASSAMAQVYLPSWDFESQPARQIYWDDGEPLATALHPEWTITPASEAHRVRVSAADSWSGGQSVAVAPVEAGTTDVLQAAVELLLPPAAVSHADFRIKPGVASVSDLQASFTVGGLQVILRNYGGGLAKFAFRGTASSQWVQAGDLVPWRDGRAETWTRITVRLDRTGTTHLADVWVNGKIALQDIDVTPPAGQQPASDFRLLRTYSPTRPVHLDDISAREINPLFSDLDQDGLPDSWEGSTWASGRGDQSDQDGLTNLQEYYHSTRPDLNDTDGDGMWDGAEIQFGFNPLIQDARGDRDGDGTADHADTNPVEGSTEFRPDRVYVRTLDDDGVDNGSAQHPFHSVAEAVATVSEGGTVVISGNFTFTELVSIQKDVNFIGIAGPGGAARGTYFHELVLHARCELWQYRGKIRDFSPP